MAKALPIVNFAQRMPLSKAMPMPRRTGAAGAGYKAGAIAGAISNTADHVQGASDRLDKTTAAKGKAQMTAEKNNATLNQMILKRQLAQRIQQAKERWQNSLYALKQKQDDRDALAATERTEAHKNQQLINTQKIEHQKAVDKWESDVFTRSANPNFGRREALDLAALRGVAEEPRVRGYINEKWPAPQKPSAGDRTRWEKKQSAKRRSQYFELQLADMKDKISEFTGKTYTRTQVIQDPFSLQRELMEVKLGPNDTWKQGKLLQLQKDFERMVDQYYDALAIAGEEPEEMDFSDDKEIQELMKSVKQTEDEVRRLTQGLQ